MSARLAVARAAAVVWLAVLTWGSLAPEESVRGAFTFGDVLVHIAGYLGLTLLFLASQRQPRLLLTGAIAMGIGILMELLQMLTSDRAGSLLDVGSNAAGVLIALGAWWIGSRITN